MRNIIQQTWIVEYLLLFLLLAVSAIILYKLYYFRFFNIHKRKSLIQSLLQKLKEKKQIVLSGKEEIFGFIDSEIKIETRIFEKYLPSLANISSVAPLLGLLGTILGMMKSTKGIIEINNTLLLKGISEALITTAIGIVIAIPAIISYNYFLRKKDKVIENIKDEVFLQLGE